jgi:RNA recognition motif-containing protein
MTCLGCGFVRFASISDAARAIHELNGKHTVDSAIGPLNVEYAAGEAERLNLPTTAEGTSVKLFVGGIPISMSDDELREYFSAYGQVTECHILPQKTTNPVIQTKAAFVRFARKADGLNAIEALD